MDGTLNAAASAMRAMELKLNNTAHNLANVSTTAFKRQRVEFQDIAYQLMRAVTLPSVDNVQVPTGVQLGQGVRTAGTLREFTTGDLRQTGRDLDVAIEGRGFFQVVQPNGAYSYTRDGAFKVDGRGRLVNTDGLTVDPQITLPRDYTHLAIGRDGTITAQMPGQQQPAQVGQLTLVQFVNPEGLEPTGRNLYNISASSGDPVYYQPGQNNAGVISQGFLEQSNVRAVDEMIDMITTQRAYEMATRSIQAADQMLGATANLR